MIFPLFLRYLQNFASTIDIFRTKVYNDVARGAERLR